MRKAWFILIAVILILFSVRVALSQAAGVDVEVIRSPDPQGACSPQEFIFKITSLDPDYQDVYSLSTDKFTDHVYFDRDSLLLNPGKSALVRMNVSLECDQAGLFEVHLLSKNEGTGEVWQTPLDFKVLSDGIVKISPDTDVFVIGENKSQATIKAKNIGPSNATYNIWLENTDLARSANESIMLQGGVTGSFKLIVSPPEGLEQGDYPFTVVMRVNDTGIEYARNLVFRRSTPSKLISFMADYFWLVLVVVILLGIITFVLILVWRHLRDTKEVRMERRMERKAQKEEAARKKEEERLQKEQQKTIDKAQKARQVEADKKAALIAKEAKKQAKIDQKKARARLAIVPFILTQLRLENLIIPKTRKESGKKVVFWVGVFIVAFILGLWLFYIGDVLIDYLPWIIVGLIFGGAILLIRWWLKGRKEAKLSALLAGEIESIKKAIRHDLAQENVIVKKSDVEALRRPSSYTRWFVLAAIIVILCAISVVSFLFGMSMGVIWQIVALIASLVAVILLIISIYMWQKRKNDDLIIPIGDVASNRIVDAVIPWSSGIREFEIKIKSAVEGVVLAVFKHRKQPTFLDPDGIAYGFFEINSNIDLKNIERVTIGFSVEKKWMRKRGIDSESVSLMRYTNGKWRAIDTSLVSENDKLQSFEAQCEGLSYFAIIGSPKKEDQIQDIAQVVSSKKQAKKVKKIEPVVEPEKVEALFEGGRKSRKSNKRWLPWLLFVAIVIALLAGLWFAGPSIASYVASFFAQPPQVKDTGLNDVITNTSAITEDIAGISGNEDGGIPPQLINGTLTLDLNQYFSDPDGEQLVFSNSRTDNLIISFEHGVASIIPKEGFYGEEVITFMATDSSNTSVSSNPVTFKVFEPAKNRPAAASQKVLIGVAFFVVIIALIIVMVFLRRSKEFEQGKDEEE